MPLTPIQRKAKFVGKAIEDGLTREQAARQHVGCGWHHLNEGLLGVRQLSEDKKKAVAAYLGLTVGKMFPAERPAAVAS